jgi:hypothetical protein
VSSESRTTVVLAIFHRITSKFGSQIGKLVLFVTILLQVFAELGLK